MRTFTYLLLLFIVKVYRLKGINFFKNCFLIIFKSSYQFSEFMGLVSFTFFDHFTINYFLYKMAVYV